MALPINNAQTAADILSIITVFFLFIFVVPSWFIGPQKYDLVAAYAFAVSLCVQCLLLRYSMWCYNAELKGES